jgi:uncharacterized protein (UPF0335 family)
MRALVDTINSIDENSKKILFKHFDQNNVNVMQKKTKEMINRIEQQHLDAEQYEIHSDDMLSESSGNNSDNDEINKIKRLKQKKQKPEGSSEEECFSPTDPGLHPKNGVNILYQMKVKDDVSRLSTTEVNDTSKHHA